MKVLQINAVNKTGSTGRAAYELAEALKQDGDIALIACSISSGVEKEYLIGSLLDHKIHALLSRIFGLQGYFSKISTKKLIRYIETEQPEIVCIENVHFNYLYEHSPTWENVGDLRWRYSVVPVEFMGTLFLTFNDEVITSKNSDFYYEQTIDQVIKSKETAGTTSKIIFWILWIIFTVVIIWFFYYMDNHWLEDHH